LSIKGFTEFHNIYTVLTQCRTNWWTWVGLAGSNLKLDVGLYFLSHGSDLLMGNNAFFVLQVAILATLEEQMNSSPIQKTFRYC
jgi:hypothetical protein